VSGLAVLLLAGGAFVYEAYFAEQVRYYRNFVKRFGEPVGVGALTSNQVHHRAYSLKLVRNGFLHPSLRMEAVDADGQCTPDNTVSTYLQIAQAADSTSPLHECRWDFVYDDKGQVVYEKAYNK